MTVPFILFFACAALAVLGKAIDGVEGDRVYRDAVNAAATWARLVDGAS